MKAHPVAYPPNHMTDAEYDRLRARLAAAEAAHTDTTDADTKADKSPTR